MGTDESDKNYTMGIVDSCDRPIPIDHDVKEDTPVF